MCDTAITKISELLKSIRGHLHLKTTPMVLPKLQILPNLRKKCPLNHSKHPNTMKKQKSSDPGDEKSESGAKTAERKSNSENNKDNLIFNKSNQSSVVSSCFILNSSRLLLLIHTNATNF